MKLPKTFMGAEVKGAYQNYLDRQKNKSKTQEKQPEESNLETLTDFWTIQNVEYRNGVYTVDLAKQLLDNGNAKTQEQWAEYSKQAQKKNGFYSGDFPLYHAVFTTLFRNKDGNQKSTIEEIRQFIKQKMLEKWIMTLTRIEYNPGTDKVIHNFGMPEQYEISEDIVGPDEWVEDSNSKETYKAILGTDNLKEVNDIYVWITEKNTYLWRLNNKPEITDVCVAGFVANSGRAYLGCYGNPQGSDAELGVRARENRIK